jgi:hypothetical protein
MARPENTIIRFPVTIGTLPDADLAVPAPMARAVYRRAMATDRAHSLPVLELGFALAVSINSVIGANLAHLAFLLAGACREADKVRVQRGVMT